MATAKKKKSKPGATSASVANSGLIADELSGPLDSPEQTIDAEPKVSFTLEFYPVDEKERSFIGRLKRIGSEEQVTLIDDLDSQVLLDFIRRNLPKTWRVPLNEKKARSEKMVALPTPNTSGIELQLKAPKASEAPIKNQQTGNLEVWQDGRKTNLIDNKLGLNLRFWAESVNQWAAFQVRFKSLETGVPSHLISRKQNFKNQMDIPVLQGELRPGIYDIQFNAEAINGNGKPDAVFTSNQLIQVI